MGFMPVNNINQPLVSVCIPVYNCEKYVGAAVESVLSQTFRDFELVVINNASTDRTLDVISNYKDSRIRIVNNKTNVCVEDNWNKALSEAKGKLIKILCADDLLYPSCLEKQVAVMNDAKSVGVVFVSCGRDIINQKDKVLFKRNFRGRSGRLAGLAAVRDSVKAGTNLFGEASALLFRAGILKKTGGFDGRIPYVIDLDLWFRMLLHGDVFVLPKSLCAFRVSSSSWSVGIAFSQAKEFKAFISKLYKDSRYGLGLLDCVRGKIMAQVNALLRRLLYMFLIS